MKFSGWVADIHLFKFHGRLVWGIGNFHKIALAGFAKPPKFVIPQSLC
jgi:hypothetical protein